MEVSDNKEIVSKKMKNKNKSVRNYIVVTVFQWGCWDDKDEQKLQYWLYSRNLFFYFNKKEEIWENKNVRLE